MQDLRDLIYDVSCHLKRNKENTREQIAFIAIQYILSLNQYYCLSVQYESNLKEDDPRALFNEQVPVSFIQLQDAIYEQQSAKDRNLKPYMIKDDFYDEFSKLFKHNVAEMKEAVRFLGYQGKADSIPLFWSTL